MDVLVRPSCQVNEPETVKFIPKFAIQFIQHETAIGAAAVFIACPRSSEREERVRAGLRH